MSSTGELAHQLQNIQIQFGALPSTLVTVGKA
jgi:hypothetical protein